MRFSPGFTLIEVLISFLILAMMLLGFDAMQLAALRSMKTAYYFSVAQQQLNVMKERLAVLENQPWQQQVILWNQQNQAVLPQGRGIVAGAYPNFRLEIFWGNMPAKSCVNNIVGLSGCLSIVV